MAGIRILGASSDEPLDFLPLNAEFDADISEDSASFGTGLTGDDETFKMKFSDDQQVPLSFSENDMSFGLRAGTDDQDFGVVNFEEVVETGSGGGGTSNYNDLSNKPSINNVVVEGAKTGAQYGLAYGLRKTPTQSGATLTLYDSFGNEDDVSLEDVDVDYASYLEVMQYLNT